MTTTHPATIPWRTMLLCAAATIAAFAKSFSFPFVNWQDPIRILEPVTLGPLTIASAMRTIADIRAVPYQPITDLGNGLNALVTGAYPAGFHAVNIALHALIALLLLEYLRRWQFGLVPAAISTLLFSLHPLRVEAVAWVSGRDELLATLFVLSSAIAFLEYRSSGRRSWYGASLIAAIAGVGSSATAAPWPLVLLLLDRPTQGCTTAQRFADFLPFFAAGLAAASIPAGRWISNVAASGLSPSWVTDAAASPSFAFLFFVWQTIAPSHLAAVYAVPMLGLWWWFVLVALVIAGVFAFRATRGRIEYRAGILWALIFLAPSGAGVTDAPGPISDRSTMLSAVGVSLLLAASVQSMLRQHQGRFARLVKVSAVLLLAVLGTLASVQSETWSSSVALWTRATDRTPTSALAHNYLGAALAQESGDLVRADRSFSIAIFHDPLFSAAYANRGTTRAALGRSEEALRDLDEALRIDPSDPSTRMSRAMVLRRSGRFDEALRDMHLAIARQPMNVPWMVERAGLLLEMGRTGEAAAELEVLRRAGYEAFLEP
ncbi:MAG: tetratricopeptide repeat protein [Bacteroidetes bacterium]|nr:tetratricopeptide repeat protein [Bacteroidota bacterium]